METDERNASYCRECACGSLCVASLDKCNDVLLKKHYVKLKIIENLFFLVPLLQNFKLVKQVTFLSYKRRSSMTNVFSYRAPWPNSALRLCAVRLFLISALLQNWSFWDCLNQFYSWSKTNSVAFMVTCKNQK